MQLGILQKDHSGSVLERNKIVLTWSNPRDLNKGTIYRRVGRVHKNTKGC